MRMLYGCTLAAAVAVLVSFSAQAQDMGKAVAGGGISVAGWTGKIDETPENKGLAVSDAKFAAEGKGFHITTGPAVTYWNTKNTASGNYTVKATFTEPKFMGLNT